MNGAVDFALLLKGRITPKFEVKSIKNGKEEKKTFDLSAVFQVDADFYQYVNGDWISVLIAISRYDRYSFCVNLFLLCFVNFTSI